MIIIFVWPFLLFIATPTVSCGFLRPLLRPGSPQTLIGQHRRIFPLVAHFVILAPIHGDLATVMISNAPQLTRPALPP